MNKENSNEDIRQFLNAKVNGSSGDKTTSHDPLLDKIWELSDEISAVPEFDATVAWDKFSKDQGIRTTRPITSYLLTGLIVIALILAGYLLYKSNFAKAPEFPGLEVAELNIRHDLPDGSLLITNEGTKVTIGEDFSSSNRQINLEGNAYCQITSDPEHPFVINTSSGTIKVLGTSFLVTQEDDQVNVSVDEGVVRLSDFKMDNLTTLIKAGERASLYSDHHILAIERGSGQGNTDIILENAQIGNALDILSKTIHLDISVVQDNNELSCRITSQWSTDNLPAILQEIELLFNAEIAADEKLIQIGSIDCAN